MQTQREEGHVKKEAEMRVMQLQAKEWQRLLGATKQRRNGKGGLFPRAFRGSIVLLTP